MRGVLATNSISPIVNPQGIPLEHLPEIARLSVLLVQIRDHGAMRDEEVESFLRYGGLEAHQLEILNVFDTPEFEPTVADRFDVVLVGGASEASVLEPDTYPFVPHIIALLRRCIETNRPVFASCFGFQAAVLGLGGRIVREETDFEMGTIPMSLSPEAKDDPLFSGVSDGFLAVSCHKESTFETPGNCIALARSPRCLHAFRVREKPFWAFQFHPELDRDCFVQRLGVFRAKYTDSDAAYEDVASQFKETPESNALLATFIRYIASLETRVDV